MFSNNPLPAEGLLRISQICGDRKRGIPPIVPVSRSTWWAGVANGRFPKPVKLGDKLTFWRSSDIRALVAKLSGVSE